MVNPVAILYAGMVTGVGLNQGLRYNGVLVQACKAAFADEEED